MKYHLITWKKLEKKAAFLRASIQKVISIVLQLVTWIWIFTIENCMPNNFISFKVYKEHYVK